MKALTAIACAVGILTCSLSQVATAATQFPIQKDARVVDLGLAPQNEVRSITLSLVPKDQAGMEAYAAAVSDPASSNYQNFLTPDQIGATYGQDATTVAQVVNFLQAQGLTVTKVYRNKLFISVSGTNAQLGAAFGSPIHSYQFLGQSYEAPVSSTAVPSQLASVVMSVHGLSTRALARSNAVRQAGAAVGEGSTTPLATPAPGAYATNTPGSYTVGDLANLYDINPLYAAGITGAGKTIGIVTLAGYNQSDAYAYWQQVGVTVNPNRITDVLVDGGPLAKDGPGSDGSGETSLDVEQSGGVAPGANMRVYLAPNSGSGFVDGFATAIDENLVDTLSVSWGSPEVFYGSDELNGFHNLFLAAAMEGIPVIAATGDAGAYDINRGYPYPACTTLLGVDFPAADPLVLGAGGTTVPHTQQHKYGTITIPQERAWAWDYLRDYISKYYGQAFYYANYFSVGGGGGVSVDFNRPTYQANLPGTVNSASAQAFYCQASAIGGTGNAYVPLFTEPANVVGRNLPDVSLNADPYSGYLVYQATPGAATPWSAAGGTSFVAPQLNGILTLIASGRNKRIGWVHHRLYNMFQAQGYGAGSPFRPVTAGTDEYYSSKANYNPATGLGTLDVSNLAHAFGVSF